MVSDLRGASGIRVATKETGASLLSLAIRLGDRAPLQLELPSQRADWLTRKVILIHVFSLISSVVAPLL
jgi:hypothetical protein